MARQENTAPLSFLPSFCSVGWDGGQGLTGAGQALYHGTEAWAAPLCQGSALLVLSLQCPPAGVYWGGVLLTLRPRQPLFDGRDLLTQSHYQ